MSLPDQLLVAIVRATADLGEQEDLARHWRRALRRSEVLAGRIREQMRNVRCRCELPGDPADDGRCSRCWGWPTVGKAATDGKGAGGGREVTADG